MFRLRRCKLGFFLVVLAVICLSGQSASTEVYAQSSDVFSAIPSEHRERLRSRLEAFVVAHKEKDWSKVFDFLGTQYLQAASERFGKEEFISKKLYSRIDRFTAKSVTRIDNGWWAVWGCGSFSNGGKMEAGLDAYLQDGEWFFSDIWSVVPCVDCKPRSCKH